MASAPQPNALPILYSGLLPLSSTEHKDWKARPMSTAPFLVGVHAVPLTAEEFGTAVRHYPIVFSVGDTPVPLALMGLNEGVNLFVDDEGRLLDGDVYIPAYIRRYPFFLARLRAESEDLSLCVDPGAGIVGPFEDGEPIFVDGEPTEAIKSVLAFCEQFEQAWQKTGAFVEELKKADILIDGEMSINVVGAPQPFVYRGFKMVSEDKLRELRGDALRKHVQSGLLPLVYAHLFSLANMSTLFNKQARLGKVPGVSATAVAAEPALETVDG